MICSVTSNSYKAGNDGVFPLKGEPGVTAATGGKRKNPPTTRERALAYVQRQEATR